MNKYFYWTFRIIRIPLGLALLWYAQWAVEMGVIAAILYLVLVIHVALICAAVDKEWRKRDATRHTGKT